jgi:FMN-dependent NADH-azoreductase
MASLLYIKASPRAERSHSIAVADEFISEYRKAHPGDNVLTVDIFSELLPVFDGPAVEAKYLIMHGKDRTPEHAAAWKPVEELIAQFKSADKYVLAVPMWNFSIPYRLKQYIDLIVQPGLTFTFDPEAGYKGLVKDKPMLVVYARGGEYSDPEVQNLDLQKKYLELVFGFIGFENIKSIIIEPTLHGGPDVAQQKKDKAITQARVLAKTF